MYNFKSLNYAHMQLKQKIKTSGWNTQRTPATLVVTPHVGSIVSLASLHLLPAGLLESVISRLALLRGQLGLQFAARLVGCGRAGLHMAG